MSPAGSLDRPLRIASRRSPLALAQAERVAALLARHGHRSEIVGVLTTGDTDRRELTQIGGTGVFATAVRDAVLTGRADLAVHSAKDLPSVDAPGLSIAAIPEREDVRDVLVGRRLADLTTGTRIGTGSPRRAEQLVDWGRRHGVELEVVSVRGNVDTRLGLVGDSCDAVLLAAAGLNRLGRLAGLDRDDHEVLDPDVMVPAGGQGALAVEIADDADDRIRAAVTAVDDALHHAEVTAERAFLARLGAGCLAPVGVLARCGPSRGTSTDLTLTAVIGGTLGIAVDPSTSSRPLRRLRATGSLTSAGQVGAGLARRAIAEGDPTSSDDDN